jgi:three-Cys-motif partner protein
MHVTTGCFYDWGEYLPVTLCMTASSKAYPSPTRYYGFTMTDKPKGANHRFGGDWTSEKLRILGGYLSAYTTALKKQNFRTAYIDAFAGSGYRTPSDAAAAEEQNTLFLDAELTEPESKRWLEGSARIALTTSPRFDKYIFIDRNRKRCSDLDALKSEFATLAQDIDIRQREANEAIQDICIKKNWTRHRAVMFLDPYGMQVEWTTIVAIARTKAIDMFLLFPLGIGVNRLLTRDADIPDGWRRRLDLLLGTTNWYDEFYQFEPAPTLFDDHGQNVVNERVVKASTATIGRYFDNQLKSVFAAVAEEPRVLRNKTGCPLYLLCFAAGNPKGAKIAVGIADYLLTRQP